jgi:hypothetical protein
MINNIGIGKIKRLYFTGLPANLKYIRVVALLMFSRVMTPSFILQIFVTSC